MTRIVTVTLNPAIDETATVDRVIPEDKLRCAAPTFEAGGGGLNVSRALARLGTDSQALWTCAGATGMQLGQLLDGADLTHQPMQVGGNTRTNLVISEQSSGCQYRFAMPGPELGDEDLELVLSAIRSLSPPPPFMVLSGSLPPGAPEDLYAQIAASVPATTKIILDSSGPALGHGLAAGVFLVKPNLRELGSWAGQPVEDDLQILAAAEVLLDAGHAEYVVVSLGAGGAIAVGPHSAFEVRSPTVPIRSKVGAGDSMVAGLVHALNMGEPIEEVIRIGVAAGAAAVMTPGSQLCRAVDVERLEALTRVQPL